MKNKGDPNTADLGAATLKQKVLRYVDEVHLLNLELKTIAALCEAYDNTATDAQDVVCGVGDIIYKHLWNANMLCHHYLGARIDDSIPRDIARSAIVRLQESDRIRNDDLDVEGDSE